MKQKDVQRHGDEAATLRLWRHTVGIVSEVKIISGSDQHRSISEQAGTGVAGNWGEHHFILTAKHLLEGAEPGDVRIAPLPSEGLKFDIRQARTIQTLKMRDQVPHIQRCEWEDLALLGLPADSLGADVEFVDMATSWVDPPEGETVHGVGFPLSHSIPASSERIGNIIHNSVMLRPVVFYGQVSHKPTFSASGFEADRHYLFSYDLANQGSHPAGISGAAAWLQQESKGIVWTPIFTFAGICTHAYRGGKIERVVKASTIRQFLEETYGPL